MDKPAALRILGLTEGAGADEVNLVRTSKIADIEKKRAAAPTPDLKKKFDEILVKFDLAADVLLADVSVGVENDSPEVTNDSGKIEFQPGDVLAGRYEIKELIGQGSVDAVYRALDTKGDREIAIKILLPALTQNEEVLELFLKEAKISSNLAHPNIANVYEVQSEDDLYFLTMELLEGQSLADMMQIRHQENQIFDESELFELMEQVVSALSYAHEQTIHREIKPENVWLDKSGKVKLTDFGIVQLQNPSERMQNCADIGTVYYMAPEQVKGDGNVDARADIYALGIMLYHLATGSVPAGLIKSLHEKRPDLSEGFCAAVMQCMASDVNDRPQTAEDLLELLQKKHIEKIVSAHAAKTATEKNRGANKSMIAAAALLLVIIGVGGLIATNGKESASSGEQSMSTQQQTEGIKLLGQINSLKKRLNNSISDLEKDVAEAKRANNKQLKTLQLWQKNSKRFIVNSNTITELEGEQAVGEGYLKTPKQAARATETLTAVKKGYASLLRCFQNLEDFGSQQLKYQRLQAQWKKSGLGESSIKDAIAADKLIEEANQKGEGCLTLELTSKAIAQYQQASKQLEPLLAAENKTAAARADWEKYKKTFSLENPAAITDAELAIEQAGKHKRGGALTEAIASNTAAQQAFSQAKTQVSGQVEAKRQKWAEGRKLDAAKLSKVKQAKISEFQKGKTVKVDGVSLKLRGIPAGSFSMGSKNGDADEKPVHTVKIKAFYLQETEVTWNQYQICMNDDVCESDGDELDGKGSRPVINVSWKDAQQYIKWLNKKTGQRFRLPSEAEWEYAARAGTTTDFSWGNNISCTNAHYNGGDGSDCYYAPEGDDTGSLEVRSFSPNAWGLYDMHGNIWEWVQDCWNDSYNGATANGRAWESGNCKKRVVRGGSWGFGPKDLRSANREIFTAAKRHYFFGFRLAQDI